jgi:hypothetical protein
MARLPADSRQSIRSPGVTAVYILEKVEMLSTPALVRVSASITSPSRSHSPTQ